jgi:hypothetical protein
VNLARAKEWLSAWRKVMVTTTWSSWDEFAKLYAEPDFNEAENSLFMFYEGLGVLVKEGLIDIRMVALLI